MSITYSSEDTIAAISTALSESGIAVIRVSGPQAIETVDKLFKAKKEGKKLANVPTFTIHYGYLTDLQGEVIDEVLVSVMRGPHTYTAEDVAEINCHGGVFAAQRVLQAVVSAGARIAEPGEFTKRAFLNGRIDLSRAEAVMDVIGAKNEYALKSSVSQLRGSVQKKISALRGEIVEESARIESALDDPEHYDLDGYSDQLEEKTAKWLRELKKLIDSADNGRLISEGINTVIVGKPNAGKSSLLNQLSGSERAIVTDIPGTTRDILTETVRIGSVMLNLIDTAGVRQTEDVVESIGVQRTRENVDKADLVLYMVDSSVPFDENDRDILNMVRDKKTVILLNKSDLPTQVSEEQMHVELQSENNTSTDIDMKYPVVRISAREGEGLEELEKLLEDMFFQGKIAFNDEVCITNERQKAMLVSARASLQKVEESIQMQMSEDFFTIDLMDAYEALGRITGESVEDDLADEIFRKFCMGK